MFTQLQFNLLLPDDNPRNYGSEVVTDFFQRSQVLPSDLRYVLSLCHAEEVGLQEIEDSRCRVQKNGELRQDQFLNLVRRKTFFVSCGSLDLLWVRACET